MSRMWRERDGTLVDVRHMTDTHIENSLAMVNRHPTMNEARRSACISLLEEEQRRRLVEPATEEESTIRAMREFNSFQWREAHANVDD